MAEYVKRATASHAAPNPQVTETVSTILGEIEHEGLPAIRRWSDRLDGWNPDQFTVTAGAAARAGDSVADELKEHLAFAREQVEHFARLQRATLTDLEVETLPGVTLGHRHLPIDAVGSYSPGGRYPLIASSIMTVTVPKVAGVKRVIAVAPPRDSNGIYAPQLYTMHTAGADHILCLGGVQALAALAFGVEDLDGVDMIVGAGNAYVAEAKRQLFGRVGIDLLAGPTEVAIIADETADASLVAADLLGQAEHGPTSPAILITTDRALAEQVSVAVDEWLITWPTAEVAGEAWRDWGEIIVCATREEVAEVSDQFAPEHLEVQAADLDWWHDRLSNYGSLFLGRESTVAYGDKAIGVNHVLPTGRAARYTGGLWVGKFLKTVTFQNVTSEGSRAVAPAVAAISDAEGMAGHAATARLRLDPAQPFGS